MRNRWFARIGVALAVLGLWLRLAGGFGADGLYLALIGLLLIAAGWLTGRRYGQEVDEPPAGFVPTGERFVDPGTRRMVEVFEHPQSHERVYVAVRGDL